MDKKIIYYCPKCRKEIDESDVGQILFGGSSERETPEYIIKNCFCKSCWSAAPVDDDNVAPIIYFD